MDWNMDVNVDVDVRWMWTEPEDDDDDNDNDGDEDETDAPSSWHKQLPRWCGLKLEEFGEGDGYGERVSGRAGARICSRPARQPASQPARTLKGTRWWTRMWTWHWTRRWVSTFVSSCITIVWPLNCAPCTQSANPATFALFSRIASLSFFFFPPLTLGHCLKCLPKWSSRGEINFQSYSWAVLSAYNFLIHFPRLRRYLFEDAQML